MLQGYLVSLRHLDVEVDMSNQCQHNAGEGTELNSEQHVYG